MKAIKSQLILQFDDALPEAERIEYLRGYEFTQFEKLKEIALIHNKSRYLEDYMSDVDLIYGYKTRYQLYDYIGSMYDFAANLVLLSEALINKKDLSDLRFCKSDMPYVFESFCTQLLEFTLNLVGKVTPKSRDGGIDGILSNFESIPMIGVQAKYYETKIGSEALRTFKGSLLLCKKPIPYGILFTTASEALLPAGYQSDDDLIIVTRDSIIEILKLLVVFSNYIIYYGEIFNVYDINESDLGDICAKFQIVRRMIVEKIEIPNKWNISIRKEHNLSDAKIDYWSNIDMDKWY